MIRHIAAFLLLVQMSLTYAQESGEILRKHFEGYGQEQWNEIQSVTVDGKYLDENYYGYKIKMLCKSPDKIRIDGVYKNQRFVEACDGQMAWIIAPWRSKYEVEMMKPQEEIMIRNAFTLGSPMYRFREHLHFKGLEDFEGELYYTFELSEATYVHTFYLGREDYRLYFEKIKTRFGTPVEVLKVTEKYKSYGEILVPIAVIFEGQNFGKEWTFDQIYLGTGANDDLFVMPEKD